MIGYRLRFLAAITLLGLMFLSGCEKSEVEPENLSAGSREIPSLSSILEKEGGRFLSSDQPPDGGGSRGDSEPAVYSYYYTDLPAGGKTVGAYVEALTEKGSGFFVVDASGQKANLPNFSDQNGRVLLTSVNPSQQMELSVQLDWQANDLSVRTWEQAMSEPFQAPAEAPQFPAAPKETDDKTQEAPVIDDSEAKDSEAKDSEAEDSEAEDSVDDGALPTEPKIFNAQEAVDFIKSLSPSVLGLSGVMHDYNIYYTSGTARVDGLVCLRLRAYELGETSGTNVFLGTYLLATDGSRLFRVDEGSKQAVELTLP